MKFLVQHTVFFEQLAFWHPKIKSIPVTYYCVTTSTDLLYYIYTLI